MLGCRIKYCILYLENVDLFTIDYLLNSVVFHLIMVLLIYF